MVSHDFRVFDKQSIPTVTNLSCGTGVVSLEASLADSFRDPLRDIFLPAKDSFRLGSFPMIVPDLKQEWSEV